MFLFLFGRNEISPADTLLLETPCFYEGNSYLQADFGLSSKSVASVLGFRAEATLEVTQRQIISQSPVAIDGLSSQLPYKCHQNREASVGFARGLHPGRVSGLEGSAGPLPKACLPPKRACLSLVSPASTPALRVGSNLLFHFPWFELELAGIRQPVVQSRGLERDDLVPVSLERELAEIRSDLVFLLCHLHSSTTMFTG